MTGRADPAVQQRVARDRRRRAALAAVLVRARASATNQVALVALLELASAGHADWRATKLVAAHALLADRRETIAAQRARLTVDLQAATSGAAHRAGERRRARDRTVRVANLYVGRQTRERIEKETNQMCVDQIVSF